MDTLESISHQASPIGGIFSGMKGVTPLVMLQPSMTTVSLAVATINIVLYLIVLRWGMATLNNPKCPCGKDWKLKYILFFPPLAILTAFIAIAWLSTSVDAKSIYGISGIMLALTAGWILLIVSGYKYLNELSVRKCTCATSDMIGDEALQVYTAVKVAWFIMIAILVISVAYLSVKTRT